MLIFAAQICYGDDTNNMCMDLAILDWVTNIVHSEKLLWHFLDSLLSLTYWLVYLTEWKCESRSIIPTDVPTCQASKSLGKDKGASLKDI